MYSSFSSRSNKINGLSPLDRKTPRNPRYNRIQSTLDTGSSMSKVELISSRQYLKRRDELFKRVSPATCRELIEDYQDQTETIFDMGRNSEAAATNQADTENGDVIEDSQSTVNNIIIGESKGIKISEYR